MIENFVLDEELFMPDIDISTQFKLFEEMGNILKQKGYVTDDYTEAITKREKQYPTGLVTNTYEVAIPHVDAKYAKVNTLYVLTSKNGVKFENSEEDGHINAKIVMGIILKDHNSHIDCLVKVSKVLQNDKLLHDIYCAKDRKQLKNLIEQSLFK